MKVNMAYYKELVCRNGICTFDGKKFVGGIDVSDIIDEHEITGDIVRINHTMESAIILSQKLYERTIQLQDTIDSLHSAVIELIEKDCLLLTGEVLE